ncbi:hypothetical protein ACFQHW_05005 [Lapidilactobacillus achengensis]|uniref:Uncharacterized protein n=1 Tax=Lapidilactobacillus achengensis TaxID=2486000 RepID=A0ABW1UMN2_9LACO|nr:hypothetical protein [Lapidilactobacillus achengensis]
MISSEKRQSAIAYSCSPADGSAETSKITLSGWSGENRGEVAVKLSLVAQPLRTRLSFELFGVLPKSSK